MASQRIGVVKRNRKKISQLSSENLRMRLNQSSVRGRDAKKIRIELSRRETESIITNLVNADNIALLNNQAD